MKKKKILILIKDGEYGIGEVRIYDYCSKTDAQYQISRRIEKEGWEADRAFLIDPADELPTEKMVAKYHREVNRAETERHEEHEKDEYERLKKKFKGVKE